MKNKQTEGIVVELRGELALVRPTAHTGCDSAYCCQGEGIPRVNIEMKNNVNAVVGDKVVFEAKEGNMLLAAFVVYMLPLILGLSGAVAGYYFAEMIRSNTTLFSITGALLLFIISLIIIKAYDRFAANNDKYRPVIIKKS
jgi:sigma-E factor negative regulatory protein RseC